MLDALKKSVYEANMFLPKYNLVTFTWGNVSGIDREKKLIVIKPSGVPYENLSPSDMVVVDFDGNRVEGDLNPSSDTPTHCVLYRSFPDIGGVVHTHSTCSTIFAQAGCGIPAYGTTHADDFYGEIPCTRDMDSKEIASDYEYNTGRVIVECIEKNGINPNLIPAVLVAHHGPFCWGENPVDAVKYAMVLEICAKMAYHTKQLSKGESSITAELLNKHYWRKHGSNAYYGQK